MFTVTFPLDIGTEVELSDGSRIWKRKRRK